VTSLAGLSVEATPWGARARYDGGEARLHRSSPGASFDVEWRSRHYEVEWEPRETGAPLVLDSRQWADAAGGAIVDDDWNAVLNALWALAPHAGGVKALLERRPATEAYLARRWAWPSDALRFVVERRKLDVLAIGSTLRVTAAPDVPYLRFRAEFGHAAWIEPESRPVTREEWGRVVAALRSAGPEAFLLTSGCWSVDAIEASEAS